MCANTVGNDEAGAIEGPVGGCVAGKPGDSEADPSWNGQVARAEALDVRGDLPDHVVGGADLVAAPADDSKRAAQTCVVPSTGSVGEPTSDERSLTLDDYAALVASYAEAVTAADWDRVASLFVPGAVVTLDLGERGERSFVGGHAIAAFVRDAIERFESFRVDILDVMDGPDGTFIKVMMETRVGRAAAAGGAPTTSRAIGRYIDRISTKRQSDSHEEAIPNAKADPQGRASSVAKADPQGRADSEANADPQAGADSAESTETKVRAQFVERRYRSLRIIES